MYLPPPTGTRPRGRYRTAGQTATPRMSTDTTHKGAQPCPPPGNNGPSSPRRRRPHAGGGALAAIAALIVAIAAITIINSGPDGADAPTTTIAPSTTVAPNLETEAGRIAFAEAIAEAFYSFDELALVDAIGTDVASTLIYVDQARSHALNSQVVERQPCDATTPSASHV